MRPRNPAAVRFELRFARTARTDAAAQPRHRKATPGQARQQVVQLRQFHLQLPFASARAARKNVQNQLGAIQDLAAEGALQVALLGRRQVAVEDHHVHVLGLDALDQLFHLARTDERRRFRPVAGLQNRINNLGARAFGQNGEFTKGICGSLAGMSRRHGSAARPALQFQTYQ